MGAKRDTLHYEGEHRVWLQARGKQHERNVKQFNSTHLLVTLAGLLTRIVGTL